MTGRPLDRNFRFHYVAVAALWSWGNLVYIDIESGARTVLTDQGRQRAYPEAYHDWLDDHTFLYNSNEDGYNNVYLYDLEKGESRQLTRFTMDLGTSEMITIEGKKYLFATTSTPVETRAYLIGLPDPTDWLH